MSIGPIQTALSDLQRALHTAQQQQQDTQSAPFTATAPGTAAATPAADTAPNLGTDAAKVVADLNAFLIGQQSGTDATAAPPGSTTTLANDLGTLLGDGKQAVGGHHHHHHAPPPGTASTDPSSTDPSGTDPSGTDPSGTAGPASLLQSVTKALGAYARQAQPASDPSAALATA